MKIVVSNEMSVLPDELWRRVLELGVQICGFTYKDLCRISITSRRLHRLSNENLFWNSLLSSDFPLTLTSTPNPLLNSSFSSSTSLSSSSSSCKSLYKFRCQSNLDFFLVPNYQAFFFPFYFLKINLRLSLDLKETRREE